MYGYYYNIEIYLSERKPDLRYASYDYCYNYFRSFYEADSIEKIASKQNIQLSYLQLGYYLASWEMLRASGWLFQKSYKHYEKLISEIAAMDKHIGILTLMPILKKTLPYWSISGEE